MMLAHGFRIQNIQRRCEKLQCLTKRLESEFTDFTDFVKFDPEKPQTNMIHIYLKAPMVDCENVRDFVLKEHDVNSDSSL